MSQFVFGFASEMASYDNGGGFLNAPSSQAYNQPHNQPSQANSAQTRRNEDTYANHFKTNFEKEVQKEKQSRDTANGLLTSTYIRIHSGTTTNGDLMQLMSDSINMQITRARDVNAPPNLDITGDSALRRTMQTFLTYTQLRQLFRDVVGSNNGQRIRALFGAPPYAFLCEGDSMLLDAAGIAHGRINMAYDSIRVPNYSQFGVATCVDYKGREYRLYMRVDAKQTDDSDRQASMGIDAIHIALDASRDGSCELICRIPRTKRLRNDSREEMQGYDNEVVFLAQGLPHMNENITLKNAPSLSKSVKTYTQISLYPENIQLLVRGVTSSSPRASTGLVRVTRSGQGWTA